MNSMLILLKLKSKTPVDLRRFYSGDFSSILLVAVLTIIFIIGCFADANAKNEALISLRNFDSPKAVGMGGCVVNNVDESSSLYNPAAFGLHNLQRNISISFPHKNKLNYDFTMNTYSIGGGYNLVLSNFMGLKEPKVGFGLSYSVKRLDYGVIVRTDEAGNILGSEEAYDKLSYLTIGAAFDYYIRLGIGFSYNILKSNATYSDALRGNAISYGIIFQLPVMRFFPHKITTGRKEKYYLDFELTPSFAYVKDNIGDDLGSVAGPLSKASRTGVSLYTAANVNKANMISVRFSWQTEKDLVGSSQDKIKSKGYEIGLFECFYLRGGELDSDSNNPSKTRGYGLSLHGLLKLLQMQGLDFGDGAAGYIADHLNMTYDFAKFKGSDLKFVKLSMSI
jgi:hypothetical protein